MLIPFLAILGMCLFVTPCVWLIWSDERSNKKYHYWNQRHQLELELSWTVNPAQRSRIRAKIEAYRVLEDKHA